MHRSVCVVFDRPRDARKAYRSLTRSALGAKADTIAVHYRRMVDGKLQVSQTRPGAGAIWGGLSMALLGGMIALFAFGVGADAPLSPWAALLVGAIFGGGFGALSGALIGTTEPAANLAAAESTLAEGRAAVVAEFVDPEHADAAQRMLMRQDGVVGAT